MSAWTVRVRHWLDVDDPYLTVDDGVIEMDVEADSEEAAVAAVRSEYDAASWDAWAVAKH